MKTRRWGGVLAAVAWVAVAMVALLAIPSWAQEAAAEAAAPVAAEELAAPAVDGGAGAAAGLVKAFLAGAVLPLVLLAWKFVKDSRYRDHVMYGLSVLWEGSEAAQAGMTWLQDPTAQNRERMKKEFRDVKIVAATRPWRQA